MEKNQYKTLKAIYGIPESYSNLLLCSNSVLVQQKAPIFKSIQNSRNRFSSRKSYPIFACQR